MFARRDDGCLGWRDVLLPGRHRPSRRLVVLGHRRTDRVLLHVPDSRGRFPCLGVEAVAVVSIVERFRVFVEASAADPGRVCEKLQISERKVRQLVARGELAVYRMGGALRFSEEDLLAYVQGCREQRRERTSRPSMPRLRHLRLS